MKRIVGHRYVPYEKAFLRGVFRQLFLREQYVFITALNGSGGKDTPSYVSRLIR